MSNQTFPPQEPLFFLCQFRDLGKDYFITDCAFPTKEQAERYVNRVLDALKFQVAEGQVFEQQTRGIVYGRNDYNV